MHGKVAGLFNSQQGTQDKPDRLRWVGIQATHLLRDIAHLQKIKHRQHQAVESRQDQRGRPFAHLAMIFAQRHIPSEVAVGFQWSNAYAPPPAVVPLRRA
jgi:hypothetical protein